MDEVQLLRRQAETTDRLMRQVFAPVTAEQASWRLDGSTANPAGQAFTHVYVTEDGMVSQLQGQPSLYESEGWDERLGFNPRQEWARQPVPNPDTARAYADAVRARTETFLAQASGDDLAREVRTPAGQAPASVGLSIVLLIHKAAHMGEISALLGCQGAKGFPF